ncbi:MAG TPA: hydrogenase maturation nickel metallochaperone HypA [Clostridiaceae bacterium]|nr:hydrogenase maturation nickel metallochaperone HypA [Clostridiaceae bacterium]
MHEIGVLMEIVKSVEKVAKENDVQKIKTLVLQIGELSSVIPQYMKTLYPAATEGTILEESELEIEILPANGLCRDCNRVFGLVQNNGICPRCGTGNYEVLNGKELYIKEILCC